MFISFCAGVACRCFNFAQALLCTTRVRQPKDLRRDKSILIILPTQGKKHILQGLFRRSATLLVVHLSPDVGGHFYSGCTRLHLCQIQTFSRP